MAARPAASRQSAWNEFGGETVSVIIPVFNGERAIARAIDSALAQEFNGEIEVIVVNDGSTDGTRAKLAKFGARIRVIDQGNAGVAAAAQPVESAGTRLADRTQ